MPASAPVIARPVTETVLPVPTFLSAKVAVEKLSEKTSPAMRLSVRVTVSLVVAS